MADERITGLLGRLSRGELSRRQFIRRAVALGVSAPALAALLAEPRAAAAAPGGAAVPARRRAQGDPTTLVIADNVTPNWITLDPAVIYEINSQAAMNMVYECLYHLPDSSDATAFAPLLADGMPELSADGLTVTIKLRSGVKFHTTGNEMTSADWVFSWDRLKNKKANPYFLAEYLGTYEAVDPLTLRLTLPSPNAALVPILAATPLSVTDSKAVQAEGGSAAPDADTTDGAEQWLIDNSAGTGPFLISQFDIDTEVVLERHPDYWGEAPTLERLIWRHIEDPNTQLQAVETGDADLSYSIDPDAIAAARDNPDLQLLSGNTLNHGYFALHTAAEPGGPLATKELRQAIGYALDYEGIISQLSQGTSIKPATVIPLGLLGTEEVKDRGYSLDLARAQELFATASGGQPVEITLTYGAGNSSVTGVALDTLLAKVKADLEQIDGLTVTLNPMDSTDRLQQFREGKLQFTYSTWSPDYPDVHTYAEPFGQTGGAAAKRVAYSNPRVDELLKQGIAELEPAARTPLYVELQELLIDDAAFLVVEQPVDYKPASTAVQGVTTHSVYMIQLRNAAKTA